MKYAKIWNQKILGLAWLINLAIVIAGSTLAWATTPFYSQDFESGFGDWSPTNTIWEVGTPTVGPPEVHDGQCAGTVLDGNYPNNANTYLVSPHIYLPAAPQDGEIWLRYWQWFDTYHGGDFGNIEISVNSGPYEVVPETFAHRNGVAWTQNLCDLSAYQGQTIRIAFHFESDSGYTDFGWYIDDVSIEEGVLTFDNPESFEGGIGDLAATRGLWEVGEPTAGPGQAHTGTSCLGTVLDGEYDKFNDTRLIFPAMDLSATPQDGEIWLRYWQWFDTYILDDFGIVEVSVDNGPWEVMPETLAYKNSGTWTQNLCDLSAYQGQSIRIAFHFESGGSVDDLGWYIDDVSIEEGVLTFGNPEGFEGGMGDLAATHGLWEVGAPTAGPGQAHSGTNCVGTVIGGNYCNYNDTRLIFPSIGLSATPQDGEIWLRYWQWFDTARTDAFGNVEVSVDNGPWEVLTGTLSYYWGGAWTQNLCDLSAYQGQSIRIAFHFESYHGSTSSGWYIDDVSIEEGSLTADNPEGFEGGMGDLAASRGLWEVGEPTIGPGHAHSGTKCVGTVIDGDYTWLCDSRLIFPSMDLSATPQDGEIWLRYWQWFDTDSGGDLGNVEVSVNHGPWEVLPDTWAYHNSATWTQNLCDLSAYQGQSIRIAFHFKADAGYQDLGWYIDDVSIEEGFLTYSNPEDFEGGIGDLAATRGLWEVGAPTAGPGQAHSGTNCLGTVVDGDYHNVNNTRLIFPSMDLSATPQDGEIWLRYWQWFETYEGADNGNVEISVDGGPWELLPKTLVRWEGDVWSQNLCDLSAYQGQMVRIAFHFVSDGSGTDLGWYIDDVSIGNGPPTVRGQTDSFEAGLGSWYATMGIWEVGPPIVGPAGSFSGTYCAGTDLDGNYPNYGDSYLVSPSIQLDPVDGGQSILMDYWHWFVFALSDLGSVEISVDGGDWVQVSEFSGNSGDEWIAGTQVDLTPYTGSSVQLGFKITTTDSGIAPGWYIDDVTFSNLDLTRPSAPTNLVVSYFEPTGQPTDPPVHRLTWDAVADPDLAWYAVYRGFDPDFRPDFSNRLALTTETEFTDLDGFRHQYNYKVAAIDVTRNESLIVAPTDMVDVPDGEEGSGEFPPHRFALGENFPNPFNPSTTIKYSLAEAGQVELRIFDARGQLVRTLVDGVQEAGPYQIVWLGDDDGGRQVASGVYMYVLTSKEGQISRKMSLVK